MTRSENLEAMASLAVLPIAAVLALTSAVATFPLGLVALLLPFFGGQNWGWFEMWLVAAVLVAVRNTVVAVEALSALIWRPVFVALLVWGVTLLAYPGWWMVRGGWD